MLAIAIPVMIASSMLLAAVGVHLWSGFRKGSDLSLVASICAWVAAGILLVVALLVWGGRLPVLESFVRPFDMGVPQGPVLPLILMAALAIPLEGEAGMKVKFRQKASWNRALAYLPALGLVLAVLMQVSTPTQGAPSVDWVTPLRFSIAVCAGLGARGLGHALQVIAGGGGCNGGSMSLTYVLLTLVSGSAALVNLWQRGLVWGSNDPVMRGGLAGAWLVWSADWLVPRGLPRLRAALTVLAALLLIVVAVRGA